MWSADASVVTLLRSADQPHTWHMSPSCIRVTTTCLTVCPTCQPPPPPSPHLASSACRPWSQVSRDLEWPDYHPPQYLLRPPGERRVWGSGSSTLEGRPGVGGWVGVASLYISRTMEQPCSSSSCWRWGWYCTPYMSPCAVLRKPAVYPPVPSSSPPARLL